MNKWILVKEDLPDCGEEVLVYFSNGTYSIGYTYTYPECAGDYFWQIENPDEYADNITHWMELPDAPKEDN